MTVRVIAPRARARVSARRTRLESLVVAAAGDTTSRGAVRLAAKLGRLLGIQVTALRVVQPIPAAAEPRFAPSAAATARDGTSEALADLQALMRQTPGTAAWKLRTAVGAPTDVINAFAQEEPHPMIVMGLGHHGRLDRLFGGETAVPVIKHARVPVLVVSPTVRELPTHAVVALDFSEASLSAALLAQRILAPGGLLTLAHVSWFEDTRSRPGDLIDVYLVGARARLDAAARRLRRSTGGRVETVILTGTTAASVVAYARDKSCDLIALGGSEFGLADRLLLGSVRTAVLRTSPCSVLIAPPAAAAAPHGSGASKHPRQRGSAD